VLVVQMNPVLTPVLAASNELELTAEQRMKAVRHPHNVALIDCAGCSRRRGPTASSSGSSARSNTGSCSAGRSATATPSPSKSTGFRQIYNTIRPHQAIDDRAPRNAYLDDSSW
jgi:hypothetical protein